MNKLVFFGALGAVIVAAALGIMYLDGGERPPSGDRTNRMSEQEPIRPQARAERPERTPAARTESVDTQVAPGPVPAARRAPASGNEPANPPPQRPQVGELRHDLAGNEPANPAPQRPLARTAPARLAGSGSNPTPESLAKPPARPPVSAQAHPPASAQAHPPASAQAQKVQVTPEFDVVRVNPAGDVVVAGVAAPNAEVVVSDGATELGRTRADKRGHWAMLPGAPLTPGAHELTLASRDGADKNAPSAPSRRKILLIVPEAGKDIAGRPSRSESGALALAVPRTGTGGVRVLQKPKIGPSQARPRKPAGPTPPDVASAAGPSAGRTGPEASDLKLDTVDYDEKGRVEISGRAPERARVQIYIDNTPVGGAEADESGQWRLAPLETVEPGSYRLRVDQIDRDGAVVARIESPFSRAGPFGDLPRGTVVFVQPGNSLWRIARRTYGRGVQFTVIYQANRRQIRDPDLIYPGQIFIIPRPVERAG